MLKKLTIIKNKNTIFYMILIITGFSYLQGSYATENVEFIQDPALFKIQKGGKHSFVFATNHEISIKEIPPPVIDYLKDQKNLVKENTLEMLNVLNDKDFCEKNGIFTKDGPLTKIGAQLTCEEIEQWREKFNDLLKLKKIKDLSFDHVEEWVAIMGLQIVCGRGPTLVKPDGMDICIADFYKADNKKVYQLEHPDELTLPFRNRVESMSEPKKIQLIKECLTDPTNQKRLSLRVDVQDKYRKGKFPELYNRKPTISTIERNSIWLPRILDYHENLDGSTLFLGGFSHWLSNKGCLFDSLQEKGFNIQKAYITDEKNVEFKDFSLKHKDEQEESSIF